MAALLAAGGRLPVPGYPPLLMPPLPPGPRLLPPLLLPGVPPRPPPDLFVPPPDLNSPQWSSMFPPLVPSQPPSSARQASETTRPSKSDLETDLMPPGVNIRQMQANPVLADAWFNHLKESGKDAEAFRQLLSGSSPRVPPPLPPQPAQHHPAEDSHPGNNAGQSFVGRT